MNARAIALSTALLAAGCVHVTPTRPLSGGETISLEAVDLQVPAEPGWTIFHRDGLGGREVRLQHVTPAGAVDRSVRVSERRAERAGATLDGSVPGSWTPERFLAYAEQGDPIDDDVGAASAATPFQLDDRFGPLGARRSIDRALLRQGMVLRPGSVTQRVFIPEDRPVSRAATVWEFSADGTTPILDGLRLAPPAPPDALPRATSAPDVENGAYVEPSLGLSQMLVQGKEILGMAGRFRLGLYGKLPRSLLGLGLAVDVGGGVFYTGDEEGPDAWLVEANASVILRRLRLGVGVGRDFVEPGSKEQDPVDRRAVTVRRGFATFDVTNIPGAALYVGVEATAPTRGYARNTVVLGWRVDLPKGLDLPPDPFGKARPPEPARRDATPSPPAG